MAETSIHLMVHVKNRVIAVSCGDGAQPVRWLANVGLARYDDAQGRTLGAPSGISLEDGSSISLTQTIAQAGLRDQQHVYLQFKPFKPQTTKKMPPLADESKMKLSDRNK